MKIYIVTYGASHVNIVVSMVDAYKKAGFQVVILAMPAAIKTLKQNNIPYKTLKDYAFLFDEWPAIIRLGNELALQYHNPESGIEFDVTADYYGVSMKCLINDVGFDEAYNRLSKYERKAFLPVEAMRKILCYEKPDALQVTADVRMELAAIVATKKLNIPSFHILDAPYVMDYPIADSILLINDDVKERYLEACFDPHKLSATGQVLITQDMLDSYVTTQIEPCKLVVTGQPVFERYHCFCTFDEKKKVLKSLGMSEEEIPLISYFSTKTDVDIKNTFKEIMGIARRNKWNIVMKLHPVSQEISDFDEFYEEIPTNVKVVKEFCTASLIAASDVVLQHDSTIGFEAQVMKKPLVVIGLPNRHFTCNYTEKGAALFASDLGKLEKIIKLALYDKNTRERLLQACTRYESSRYASENIVSFIKKTLLQKNIEFED